VKVAKSLLLAVWMSVVVGIILLSSTDHRASAHEPFIVVNGDIWSWGANAVHNNVANGTPCSSWVGKIIAVNDTYGLSSSVKNSNYYPSNSWDGTYMCVDRDATPVDGGTAIYLYGYPQGDFMCDDDGPGPQPPPIFTSLRGSGGAIGPGRKTTT
jgi:hypothetical protein